MDANNLCKTVVNLCIFTAVLCHVTSGTGLARDLERMERELSVRAAGKDGVIPPGRRTCVTPTGTYKHNMPIPTTDPCKQCHCHLGNQICMSVMCAYPMCVDRNMHPDVCCNTCPNGDNCWLDGAIISADRPIIQHFGRCTRYCNCPRSMSVYSRYGENTYAHCIVHCEEETEEQLRPGDLQLEAGDVNAGGATGPQIGEGQVEAELPFPQMFQNYKG